MAKTNGTMKMKIAMLKWDNITVSLENNTAMRVIMTVPMARSIRLQDRGTIREQKTRQQNMIMKTSTTIISERCYALLIGRCEWRFQVQYYMMG